MDPRYQQTAWSLTHLIFKLKMVMQMTINLKTNKEKNRKVQLRRVGILSSELGQLLKKALVKLLSVVSVSTALEVLLNLN